MFLAMRLIFFPIPAVTLSDLRSDDKKKGIFRLFSDILWINLGHESLLFKQGFPLTLRKVSYSVDQKLRFLFRLFFWLENHS